MSGAKHAVAIAGCACCTSVGYALGPSVAAMAAGISNFEQGDVRGALGTAATVARVAAIEPDLPRGQRMAALTRLAAEDLRPLLSALATDAVPMLVALPADVDGAEVGLVEEALDGMAPARRAEPWAYPHGRAGGFAALAAGRKLLQSEDVGLVVVGGVDSLCARPTLLALAQADRLLGPGTEGTIPGEAAGFVVLARGDQPAAALPTAIALADVTLGRAEVPFLQADRVHAGGLAATFGQLREKGAARVDRVIAAHSGEGYFARAFSHAYLRQVELMPEPLDLVLTADRVGDVGAAAPLIGIAFATWLMARGGAGAAAPRILLYTESDTGEIGAAIVEGRPQAWWRPTPASSS